MFLDISFLPVTCFEDETWINCFWLIRRLECDWMKMKDEDPKKKQNRFCSCLTKFKTSWYADRTGRGWKWKWSDIRPRMVTHTRNLCSAFNPSKVHTHSSEHTHTPWTQSMLILFKTVQLLPDKSLSTGPSDCDDASAAFDLTNSDVIKSDLPENCKICFWGEADITNVREGQIQACFDLCVLLFMQNKMWLE